MKSFRASAFFLIAIFASIAAQAADFKVLLDLDNQPSTGCAVITGSGTFSGVEAVLTTTVDIVGGVQHVTGVSRQQCVNGTFAAPITVDSSGWTVGTDPSGKVVVETKVSFSELSVNPIDSAHVAFVATSGGLADVILSRSDSSPIIFPDHVGRRRSGPGTSRPITLDGDLSDWGMIAPLVDGNASTGSSNFRFTNIYGYAGNTHLYFAFELRNNRNAPTAVDDSFFVLIGQALNVSAPGILGNDISPNGAPLSAILVSGPQHGALTLNPNGSFVYLHDGSNAPQDSFRYKATNGTVDSNTAQVRIDITTNTAPHALPDSGYTVAHRGTLTVPAKGVLINDSDADGDTLHAQLASNPSHGTVTLNADGSFTYTHDGSNTLTDSFTYRAADGSSTSNVATVTITISPDIPPVAVADGYALLEGATLNVPAPGLFANDTDVDTPQSFWSAVVVTPPAHGNLTMLPGGGFTYVNDSVTGASDSFTYRVNDGIANGNIVTVPLTVTPVNDVPVFAIGAPVTVLDTDGAQSIPFVTSSNGGASDELGQVIDYLVTNDNNPLFSVQPFIDGAGVLHFTPIAGMSGVANLTMRAHDNGGVANGGVDTSAPQTSAVNVDKIPSITSANTTTFLVGQAGTFTVTTNGLPQPSIAEVGALPAGVTFVDGTGVNKGTGVLSGTPAANTGGSYPITFQATNPHGSSPIQNFTLIVNQPPVITSSANAVFTRNSAGTFTITTTGFPAPALTETGALPAGLSFLDNTNGTATLSGTPTAVGGIYSITVNANNGVGGTVQQTLTITINEAPAITSGNATNFQAGTPATFSVTTTGFPAPALGETGALPTGITFTDNGNGTATLGGNAANGSGGVYAITITATNVAGSAPQSFTITVCNNIVVTAPGVTSATAGSAFSQTFTQTGAVGGATFTTASPLPTGITLATNGTLSGTPTQTGSFPIVVTVTDGNGCTGTSATYTLAVGCQTITVTNPGVNSGVAGAAFSQTFTQTGAIGGATFTTASPLPTGLTLSTGGVLSGTPTVTGVFPIVVTVTDGNGCTGNGATYTLTINCQTITVTNPGVNSGTAAAAFSQTFTQTGAIGGATFTTSSTLPAGLALSTGGVLSGTPTQVGSFPIVVTVTDGNGCTGVGATYTLTITCQTITVTNPGVTTGTVSAAFSQTFTQTGGIGTTTFSTVSTLPAGLSLSTAGVLSGTPTQNGSFPIVVTATDANGCTGSGATWTLVINCQTITVTNPGVTTGTVSAAFSQTFTQVGAIGTATFTTASTLPAGISLATNGTLAGVPTQSGSFPIVVTVTDSNGCTGTSATYTLVINCQTITVTNPSTPTGPAGTPYSGTFTQTGAVGTATFTTASTLPTGLTLSTSGVLSGTPMQGGTFPIVVTVTDSNGCTGSGTTFTLIITCPAITVTNPGVNTGTAGVAFSQTFTQTGAVGTATFTTASTLPTGITLSTAGVLSGTTTQVGTFPIVVTVTDSNGCTGTGATYNLTIGCQTVSVTNPGVNTGTVDAAFTQTFTVTGILGTVTWSETGTLPAGITLDSSTGVLSGTPTVAGSFPITVKATDTNGCFGTSSYTLTINCQTITVTNPGVNTGTVNAPFSQTFTQTAAHGTATFTTASTLPAGLSLSTAGVLSGTPTQNGSFPIVVTVTDSNGCTGTGATYTLTINCQTITVTNPAGNTGTRNAPFTATFTQTGAQGSATFTTASTLPTGITLATNGVLSGTTLQTGTFPIVVTVTDSNGCTGTGATYNLTINCQTITVTNPVTTTGTVASPFSQTFTQTGAIGGATFTTASTLPTGLSLATNGTLSGTPTQSGSFPIVVTVTDGGSCIGTGSTYTLVIACNVISVTNPVNNIGTAGSAFSETFTQTGGNGTITWSKTGALPAGITLNTSTGVLSGVTSVTGTFPITVTATDGNGCTGTGATYNLTINCQTITVTNPVTNTAQSGVAFDQVFTATGILGTVTWSETGTLPTGITLNPATGHLSGSSTQLGVYPITVTATDTNLCFGTGTTYTLSVTCPTITVAKTPPGTFPTGVLNNSYPGAQNVGASGGTGPYTFVVASGALPGGLTLSSGGNVSGTPTATGTFTFTVTATDANSCQGTSATLTIKVAPQVTDDTFNGVGNTQFIGVNATVPTTPYISTTTNILTNDVGPGLTVNPVTDAPTVQGGKITLLSDGSFDYRPAAGFTGTDQYTYGVTSNGVTSASNIIFNVTNKVWYVKNNYGSAGTGLSNDPFQKLAGVAPSAENSSGAGDIIYVMTGDGTTLNQNAGITLKANQQLIGQGVALVVSAITIQGAGTKPLISNAAGSAVVLAAGNTVKGLTVTGPSANGIIGTSVAGFTGDTLTLQGAGAGSSALALVTVTGTVTLTNTTISNSPTGVTINGGTATVTIDNTNTINSSAGQRTVSILNRGAGANNITIGAAINDSGTGISVTSNTVGTFAFTGTQTMATTTNPAVTLTTNAGATITFSGTLGITTTTGSGFVASGGGTLNVGGTATISTGAAGSALSLNGMTIGAAVTFNSVSSTGATTGIALTTVAGLVTVNGGTLTNGATGISLQGPSTSLTLANVTITGPTTGITNTTNFGTLTIGSSVNVSAVSALNLTTGAISGTFANVTSSGGTNGVNLNAVTGSWGATAGTLTGASGATFNVTGGSSGTISWGGAITQASAATAVTIAGSNSNTINFSGNVTSSGNGISIGASSGTYNFAGAANALTGAGGIAITSASGSISFGSGTSINVTSTSFAVTTSSAAITYSGTITQNNAGTKLLAIDTYSVGTLTMNGTSLSGSVAAPTGVISTLNNITGTVVINNLSLTSSNINFANTLVAITGTNTAGSMTFNHLVLSATGATHTGKGLTAVGGGTITITATGGASSIDVGSTALDLNGVALGASTIATLNSLGVAAQNGVLFTNVTGGTLTITGGAITGNTASAFKVSGGTATISYGGTITQNTAANRAVDIVGATAGTITLSGAIGSSGGTGVFLNNNTGATINISGAMTLSTAAAAAFTATGGGTVNVTNAGNSITTSSGAGINWNGVTGTSTETFNTVTATTSGVAVTTVSTGATNFTFGTISSQTGTAVSITTSTGDYIFTKISSNGAAKGISVTALTGGGSFTVNGTGGLCDSTHIAVTDCTGGTIQAASARGIEFTNAVGVTLKNMYLKGNGSTAITLGAGCNPDVAAGNNTACNAALYFNGATTVSLDRMYLDGTGSADNGLNGNGVSGFSFTNSEVRNFTGNQKDAANMQNLTGTATITSVTFDGNKLSHNWFITNNTGTANITFTTCTIQNSPLAGTGNASGITARANSGSVVNISAINCTFNNIVSNAVNWAPNAGGTMTAILNGGTATQVDTIDMTPTGNNSTLTYTITGMTITTQATTGHSAINVGRGSVGPNGTNMTENGTVTSNIITVNSSTCSTCAGIVINSEGQSGSSTTNVSNNTISGNNFNGIRVVANVGNQSMNLTMRGNTMSTTQTAVNAGYGIDIVSGGSGTDANCLWLNLGDMSAGHTVPANKNNVNGAWTNGSVNKISLAIFDNSQIKMLNYAGANDAAAAAYVAASNVGGADAFHLGTNQFTGGASCP